MTDLIEKIAMDVYGTTIPTALKGVRCTFEAIEAAGYRVVPAAATGGMLEELDNAHALATVDDDDIGLEVWAKIYTAMLAAAPKVTE